MDPKVAKKTQDTLGKIIKKPPLTEKLLGKPPFRFLHDIMTSVIKTTGFMKGLYTDAEMNSENVKDKDAKINFLQKAVDMVSVASGKTLSVKPTKVVAGHEPDKTNEFLQILADVINKKVDSDECVKKVLKKDSKGSEDKPEKDKSDDRKKREDSSKAKGDGKPEKSDREKEKSGRDRDRERDERHREKEERHRDRDRRRKREDNAGKENESPAREKDEAGAEKESPTRMPRPTSAKGSRRQRESMEQKNAHQNEEPTLGEDDLPPQVVAARKMARPASARPAPPRPKQEGLESEPAMRLGTGQPTNVIVDDGKDSDEDETFLVEETAAPLPQPEEPLPVQQDADDDAEHGALVKKMLESKKENQQASGRRTEIERPMMTDAARRKQREQVQKEIEKLRSSIQSVTRSANPLGKIMDYVQEDLDSMQKELERWKMENKEHALALKRERGITNHAVEPLKAQLAELDQAIKDQLDQIAATKSNILRNDQKIAKMLKSIAKS